MLRWRWLQFPQNSPNWTIGLLHQSRCPTCAHVTPLTSALSAKVRETRRILELRPPVVLIISHVLRLEEQRSPVLAAHAGRPPGNLWLLRVLEAHRTLLALQDSSSLQLHLWHHTQAT